MPDHTAQEQEKGDLWGDRLLERVNQTPPLIPPFDGILALRGIACCMVVVFHCLATPLRNSLQFRGVDLTWMLFGNGFVGVWIFFCLSGYLMGKAFFSGRYEASYPGFVKFYRNRALRIIPLYYFVIFFQTVLVHPNALRIENWGYIINLLTFNLGNFPPDMANTSLWSLSKEGQFYLIVPLAYLLTRNLVYVRKGLILMLMGGIIAGSILFRAIVWSSLHGPMNADFWLYSNQIYAPVIANLDVFFVSFLMNAIFQNRCQTNQKPSKILKYIPWKLVNLGKGIGQFVRNNCHILGVLLFGAFYLFTAYHLYSPEQWLVPTRSFPGPRTSMMTLFLPSVTAVVVCLFIAAFEAWGQSRYRMSPVSPDVLLKQPIRMIEILGVLSYGIYVWHGPILNNIRPIHTNALPLIAFLDLLTAILLLAGIAATITYYTVELPAARWKSAVKVSGSRSQEKT